MLTGNPLRRQILDMVERVNSVNPPNPPCSHSSLPPFDKGGIEGGFTGLSLFVFGGSQGAHAINMAMVAALPMLKQSGLSMSITHQTGEKDHGEVVAAYRNAGVSAMVTPFIADMAAEYAKANLIVCRAGATTIAEITACGKACLFIPFPHAVDDHQRKNAEALLKQSACFLMLEQELSGRSLAEQIMSLARDPDLVRRTGEAAFSMARLDAAKIIVDEMIQTNTMQE